MVRTARRPYVHGLDAGRPGGRRLAVERIAEGVPLSVGTVITDRSSPHRFLGRLVDARPGRIPSGFGETGTVGTAGLNGEGEAGVIWKWRGLVEASGLSSHERKDSVSLDDTP